MDRPPLFTEFEMERYTGFEPGRHSRRSNTRVVYFLLFGAPVPTGCDAGKHRRDTAVGNWRATRVRGGARLVRGVAGCRLTRRPELSSRS